MRYTVAVMRLVHLWISKCVYCHGAYRELLPIARRPEFFDDFSNGLRVVKLTQTIIKTIPISLAICYRCAACNKFLGHLQDGCHDVPLSSWSGTSVPRRPFHHVLRRRFSASFAFCKPLPAHWTSLLSQRVWPSASGVFGRRSDGLELAACRAQRSGVWFW